MTVVVGFVGADGVVMASDSEATEADHTRFDASKIWTCHDLLLGYSGNTAVEVPLAEAFERELATLEDRSRKGCAECLQEAAHAVLDRIYRLYLPRPPEGVIASEVAGHLLVAGHDDNGYWLGHLNESAMFTFAARPFHAIGAGSVGARVANGLLSRYAAAGSPVGDLRLIAHRTVAAIIAVLGRGYGIGGDVLMWESLNGDPFRELGEDELSRVATAVEQWITIEQESLPIVTGSGAAGTGEVVTETDSGILIASELPADLEPLYGPIREPDR